MRFGVLVLALSLFALSGCAYKRAPYVNTDLTKENWQYDVQTSPNGWMKGADSWFLDGNPNVTEESDRTAPDTQAISTMMVRIPNTITNIKVEGFFQVQIFGADDRNSLYFYGPNADVREIETHVTDNTLYIRPTAEGKQTQSRVIVRIGILNLKQLIQAGPGSVEARMVRSDGLGIVSNGSGPIYVSGNVNLHHVSSNDRGSVNVIGAVTPHLIVKTMGSGCVNVSGNLGVHAVLHHGKGDINLIGVNSRGLKIYADGKGKIGLNGMFSIYEIVAKGNTSVFAYNVQSDSLNVFEDNLARVGLAGYVNNLTVDAAGSSHFEGRNLRSYDAYVRAKNSSHVNVTVMHQIFATASDAATIYVFGAPKLKSEFITGDGVIMPIWGDERPTGFSSYRGFRGDAPCFTRVKPAGQHHQAGCYK